MNNSKKHKIKKEMEYEEAPSGFVTLYNYKEPFMEFTEGFGYQGVLLFDGTQDTVQCHYCGEWYQALAHHLKREHNMTVSEYKTNVGLNQTTALIGEKYRDKLIASGLDKRLQNLRSKGRVKSEAEKKKIGETLRKVTLENKNIRGTCPEQLIDRLKKKYNELGRTPFTDEIPSRDAMKLTFGSIKNACEIAGIPYRQPSQTTGNPREIKREEVVKYLAEFIKKNGHYPSYTEMKADGQKRLSSKISKMGWNKQELKGEAIIYNGEYASLGHSLLGKEGLIFLLQNFEKIHGRRPSYSDARRKLVAPLSNYYHYFGSWKEALKCAFDDK